MKKLFILIFFTTILTSCTKDLAYLNDDPKRSQTGTVPAATLFTGGERFLARAIITPNVNSNIFRLTAQQWEEVTYNDESSYNINTRSIPDNFYGAMYRDVLKSLEEAKTLIPNDVQATAGIKKNQTAQVEILQVYTYLILVNTFGNVPYTDALNSEKTTPKYDDAKSIYASLITRLNNAITSLDPANAGMGAGEILYGDDIPSWIKFGNSIKLKIALLIADDDAAQAKTLAEQAAPNVFSSNADNAAYAFLGTTPNTNPVWENLVQSQRNDFVPSSSIVNIMNGLNDPRREFYFTLLNGAYVGGTVGERNSYSANSHVSDKIKQPAFEGLLLDYPEIEFCLAEAVERGFNVGGTAASHYENGVRASISYWGGTDAVATAYLATPSVAYATATGTYKQKIGTQKYIALYNRGYDAWTEVRRLDFPALRPPSGQPSYLNRFTYPIAEQNINKANYDQASAAIGGDRIATKLFWDKF